MEGEGKRGEGEERKRKGREKRGQREKEGGGRKGNRESQDGERRGGAAGSGRGLSLKVTNNHNNINSRTGNFLFLAPGPEIEFCPINI